MRREPSARNYQILPFRFKRENDGNILLTNEVGEFITLSANNFNSFVSHLLETNGDVFHDLAGKHFLASDDIDLAIEFLATKFRTKKRFLADFTALHMIVPTLACNSRCVYCQVSSRAPSEQGCSMSVETAREVVEMIFKTRSPSIKIEFQGGEPLLRFDLVKRIVAEAEDVNRQHGKYISFVICTNLTLLKADHLSFLKDHDVLISTSLD